MRSKLLSLHLVLTILNSHMTLIVDPASIIYSSSSNDATTFVQAINQYLCLSLSRNAVSPVPQVFDISVEIFWRVLSGMRTKLKVCPSSDFKGSVLNPVRITERNRGFTARNIHTYP
jgi:brefeldin A-inhibited guanine nucleotide-exchange protein